jgi:hypothetical protein
MGSVYTVMNRLFLFCVILLLTLSCSDDDSPKEVDTSVVYFEVAEVTLVRGDSYLLPLRDPVDVQQARTLLSQGTTKIVVAEINKKQGDKIIYNKDLDNNRAWSWYVSDFIEFADFTIEILDANPEWVEENYDEWVRITKGDNGKGRIGFWNYAIVREVPLTEIQ